MSTTDPRTEASLLQDSFEPHQALRNPHLQTLTAALVRRRTRLLHSNVEPRIFNCVPGVSLLGLCSWQRAKISKPTIVLVHGLAGSADSPYMMGCAEKALAAGFNVVRLNLRMCGNTMHLSSFMYHAGLTDDLAFVIDELIQEDRLEEIYVAGFSLGGNMTMKLSGEWGSAAPRQVRGVAAVSPSLDLASCANAIELSSNRLYQLSFIWSLRNTLRLKAHADPGRYDTSALRGVWTIRKFDDVYTAPHSGFRDSADYYAQASALPFIPNIHTPALIIHAQDDPFIPFEPFTRPAMTSNPNVTLIAPEHGGHVGFVSARVRRGDRFWAESKVIDFVALLHRGGGDISDRS